MAGSVKLPLHTLSECPGACILVGLLGPASYGPLVLRAWVPRVPREGALLSVELAVALLAALAALSAMAALKMLIPLLLPRLLCGLSGVAKLARPEYEFVVHVQVQEIFAMKL